MGNIQFLNKSIENHFPLVFILFFLGAGLLEQGAKIRFCDECTAPLLYCCVNSTGNIQMVLYILQFEKSIKSFSTIWEIELTANFL